MVGVRGRRGAGLLAAVVAVGGCNAPHRAGHDPAVRADKSAPATAQAMKAAPPAPAAKTAVAAFPGRSGTRIITNFPGPLDVPTGQSIILKLNAAAERVAIADPEVAEVVLIGPQEVLINGKGKKVSVSHSNIFSGDKSTEDVVQEAKTSVIIWDKAGHSDVRTLYINRARTEQIVLEAVVAELNRSAIEAMGFDFSFVQGNIWFLGSNAKLAKLKDGKFQTTLNPSPRTIAPEFLLPDNLTYLLASPTDDFLAFAELMQQDNLAKILARPTIIARSGEEAHFRVGGEVPVIYATANVASVNFKEFGVLLTVTPTLTDDGTIDLRVSTEVSQPTNDFATTFAGFSIPAFVSRKADTRVRLRELESLMIGGLYRDDETEVEVKTPYLGDLPYVGALFRRTRFERTKKELVIVVKPRIARKPSDVTPATLPTDRGPLTRDEVRTQVDPHEVTRPRFPLTVPAGPNGNGGEEPGATAPGGTGGELLDEPQISPMPELPR